MQTRQCSAHDVEQCWVCKIPEMYHNVHLGVALSLVEAMHVKGIRRGFAGLLEEDIFDMSSLDWLICKYQIRIIIRN